MASSSLKASSRDGARLIRFLNALFIYQSKDGKQEKVFDALEWLAAMCSHVPDKGEQMVRYGACPPLAELL